jgi:glutathione synthase
VITAEEEQMVKVINPILSKLGIVMYGVDTLTDDNGKRVLSEINTTSIGGLRQIQELYNQPILKRISDRLWNYLIKKL